MNTHFLPSQNKPKAFTSEPLSPSQQHHQHWKQQMVVVKMVVDELVVAKLMRLLYWVKWGTVTNVSLVSL